MGRRNPARRPRLERMIHRASERVVQSVNSNADAEQVRDAQDDLSDAVAELAAYLLETGEGGWINSALEGGVGSTENLVYSR